MYTNKKISVILGKIYGEKLKTDIKTPCYIGEILSSICDKSIGAHSISKSNNFEEKQWYGWEHDGKDPDNKKIYLSNEILKTISPDNASVTHTICHEHDTHFSKLFEGSKNVDTINPHHILLLNLRTFVNLHDLVIFLNKKCKESKIRMQISAYNHFN